MQCTICSEIDENRYFLMHKLLCYGCYREYASVFCCLCPPIYEASYLLNEIKDIETQLFQTKENSIKPNIQNGTKGFFNKRLLGEEDGI